MNRRQFLASASAFAFAAACGRGVKMDTLRMDANYAALVADRGIADRVVHMAGDSILRGWALGSFPDEQTGLEPLSGFRSVSSTANMVLAENGLKDMFAYAGRSMGWPDAPASIRESIAAGIIRAGDFVVLEDAGPHGGNTADYKSELAALVAAVTDRHNITCVVMTMFDYVTDEQFIPGAQYDADLGAGKTMNDVVREVAAEADGVGQVILVDMNAKMDYWKNVAFNTDNLPVMHPDGIHPNVWGQMFMTGQLLKVCGFRPYIQTVKQAVALAVANSAALSYGSNTFSPSRVEDSVRFCLQA